MCMLWKTSQQNGNMGKTILRKITSEKLVIFFAPNNKNENKKILKDQNIY